MPQQNLDARREEARLAMEGDEHRKAREDRERLIGKRRVDARLAMESPTHRAKREIGERALRDVVAASTAQIEAERARREAAEKTAADSKARAAAEEAAVEAGRAARIKAARQAAGEIEDLKGRPAHLSAIRTLKTDMAEAVNRGGSIAGAVIREGELRGGRPAAAAGRQSRGKLAAVLILLGLGVAAAGGTIVYRKWVADSPAADGGSGAASTTPSSVKPSLIPSDRRIDIETNDQTLPILVAQVRASSAEEKTIGTIDELIFSKNGIRLSFRDWQTVFNLPFSDGLIRGLEPDFMFGFYHGLTGNVPLIILKTKSASQSYSQLLVWENSLPIVWDALLGKPPVTPPLPESGEAGAAPRFHDRIIQNLDTRVLEGVGVSQPALYGLLDSNTIVFTQTREAFLEILTRFRIVQ